MIPTMRCQTGIFCGILKVSLYLRIPVMTDS